MNIICEYHLGSIVQNRLYDLRIEKSPQEIIINLLMESPSKKIPTELENNIKNAIETFLLTNHNKPIDKNQTEIINLYLESIKIDDEFKNKILNSLSVVKDPFLKETLEVHCGTDRFLDNLLENF